MAISANKIKFREPQIEMAHGAGGIASRRLVEGLFAPLLFGAASGPLGDAAHIQLNGTRIAVTTDSFVVKPLRFPGGSIGELAINGTVNDLAVSGARTEAIRYRPRDSRSVGSTGLRAPGRPGLALGTDWRSRRHDSAGARRVGP